MHNKFYDVIYFVMLHSKHSTKCGIGLCSLWIHLLSIIKESVEYAINFVANFVSCHEVSCVYLIRKTVIISTDKSYAQSQYHIRIQCISMW